ncbi:MULTISPECIES: hypothetical protein [Shewanella]|uniref:Uncharacterized protein n=1 Tax=Shewanella metallivivens TaxID=2872342 RepID=A0ABT5TIK6_9GAMM|nr:hypothetical protein [Shewanella metallivivens]MDD8058307.1 hypothetical protein [Shewanella metallivivens]
MFTLLFTSSQAPDKQQGGIYRVFYFQLQVFTPLALHLCWC